MFSSPVRLLANIDVTCPRPSTPLHGVQYAQSYKYSSNVQFSCDSGYNPVGHTVITCQSNGTWSSASPQCKPVECPKLVQPENSSLNTTHRVFGTVAGLFCDLGYKHSRQQDLNTECLATGVWSQSLPTCEMVQCPQLAAPHYVRVAEEGKVFGSQLTWTCRDGFAKASGDEVRQCGLDGEWSRSPLVCKGNVCIHASLRPALHILV